MFWKLNSRQAALAQFRGTLAFRLTAAYALAGLAMVTVAVASLYLVLVQELEKSTTLFLEDKVNVLRTMLQNRPGDWDGLREEIELESAARRYEQFYVRLLNPLQAQLLITPGMTAHLDLAELTRLSHTRTDRPFRMQGPNGHAFRVLVASAQVGSNSLQRDTLQIAVDVSQKEILLARYRSCFWSVLFASSCIFPFVGYRIARQGIRPVEEMATTARHISSTNLRERIRSDGYPLELAGLAATFNQMLDRLENSFERISRFSADIAHDLRTPVNNIRGETEVALSRERTASEYREVVESCLEEAVQLSELIGDLLFLSRADSPLASLRRERVDLGQLMGALCEYYDASAADGGISLSTRLIEKPVIADVDRSLVQRAVGNLISNALAHTPPGGDVVLSLSTASSMLHIQVSDNGEGIPAEALPRVFDRFFRVDSSRSKGAGSSGLGLAIVQSIAMLHGGNADIESQLGRGTCVSIRIPISPAGQEI